MGCGCKKKTASQPKAIIKNVATRQTRTSSSGKNQTTISLNRRRIIRRKSR